MDTLIKIMFLIALFILNYTVLKGLYNMNATKLEETIVYLLGAVDVAACVTMLANFHPDMGAGLTIVCGFISAMAVFVLAAKCVVKYA